MKTKNWFVNWVALGLIVSVSATIAQSTFSGIYSGSQANGDKIVIALTKGGRALGLSDASRGVRDTLNPAKSTVSSDGKFKGVTYSGDTVVTGRISSAYKLTGTVTDVKSIRFTCTRIYK